MSIFRCRCFENIPPSTPNECDMPLSIVLSFDSLSLCILARGFVVSHITGNCLSSRHLQITHYNTPQQIDCVNRSMHLVRLRQDD